MYETLIDELEDAQTNPDDPIALAENSTSPAELDEDESADIAVETAAEDDIEPNESDLAGDQAELIGDADAAESWSDDPVRMYLTQMGEIPLLTRTEEISLAKRIEITDR